MTKTSTEPTIVQQGYAEILAVHHKPKPGEDIKEEYYVSWKGANGENVFVSETFPDKTGAFRHIDRAMVTFQMTSVVVKGFGLGDGPTFTLAPSEQVLLAWGFARLVAPV